MRRTLEIAVLFGLLPVLAGTATGAFVVWMGFRALEVCQ